LLVTQDSIVAGETFVPIAKIKNSKIIETNNGQNAYNRINDVFAQRTKEESGNYIINPFTVSYDSEDASNLQLTISEGTAYVNGYRVNSATPTKISVERSSSTTTFNNQAISADYGSFVIATAVKGAPGLPNMEQLNISSNTGNIAGTIIGKCRVRAYEKLTDGTFKVYIFDIRMNSGANFRSARGIGTNQTSFFTLKTITNTNNNVIAEIEEASDVDLLFRLPSDRTQSVADASLSVQRVFTSTTDSSGQMQINLSAPGETFTRTTDWIAFRTDSGPEITLSSTPTGSGTTASTIQTGQSSTAMRILGFVNKSQGSPKAKTIATRTTTGTPAVESDGSGNIITALRLGVNDIIKFTSINADSATGRNVEHFFDLDNGQRDAFYDEGKIILKTGFTNPGTVVVVAEHYNATTSGDFFSVNSYNTTAYSKIPTFTSKTGEVIQLRDVLDFRPYKDANGNFTGGGARIMQIPKNTDTIISDNTYFLPRNDKIVVNETAEIKVIQGSSSLTPRFPETPANSLELYRVKMGANTLNGEDVSYDLIESKGFTMKDIGKLERRIEQIEDLHSLSILELDTNKLSVVDSSGNERVKVGFIVDNFKDQSQSAVDDVLQYRASIDPKSHSLRPGFYENNIGLVYDSADAGTSGVMRKGDNIYLNFHDSAEIFQDQVSRQIDVNGFDVFQFNGHIKLSPSSDEFRDTTKAATKSISGTNALSNKQSTLWDCWKWNWHGTSFDGTVTEDEREAGGNSRSFGHSTSAILTGGLEAVEKTIVNRVVSSESIRKVIDDRVVDIAIIPFMRSRVVHFEAIGMRPNTRVFPYFDNVDVSSFCREEAFAFVAADSNGNEFGNLQDFATAHPSGNTNLTTDAEGKVSGTFFIPNTATVSFRTGVREFKLLDITTSNETNASTKASALFNSSGVLERNRTNVISTRHIAAIGADKNVLSDRVIGSSDTRGRIDPLAQSFFVNNETGMFVNSVELYFAAKDTNLPVWIQIIPLIGGTPSREVIVPGSTKYLSPASVNTSTTGSTSTTFTFDEPIFLDSFSEYVIAVQSDSKSYKIWAGQSGDLIVGSTEERVTKRSVIGALYLPQNSYKWEPVHDIDLKFKINRCVFATGNNHKAILNNADLPRRLLVPNPINVRQGSGEVTIFQEDHGLQTGDQITIENAGIIGNLTIDGTHTITAVDGDTIKYQDGGTANVSVDAGGLNVTNTVNYQYDVLFPYLETLTPQDTSIDVKMKQTTGKSIAGAETPYVKDNNYLNVTLKEDNYLEAPRVVTNVVKGKKSAQMEITMASSNNYVSPVIDLQRASLSLIGNRIDNQAVAAAAGFNVPALFTAETDHLRGSMLSKHVTKPVSLLSDAVGLKVLLSANRPSAADFDLYIKTSTGDDNVISNVSWTLVGRQSLVPSDESRDVFREYTYLIGGDNGALLPFTIFQLKIVFKSTNSSKVPVIKDLRAIALGV